MSEPPADALAAARRSLAIDVLTAEVVRALERAGIEAILLKGPVIGRWLYRQGPPRIYDDIDLLVAPDCFEGAERVLDSLGFGYELEGAAPSEEIPHGHEWIAANGATAVDLHHSLTGVGADDARVWEAFSRVGERMDVGGLAVLAPAEPLRALVVALHVANHGVQAVKPREDLTRAVAQCSFDTWREAADIASELDAVPALAAGLRAVTGGSQIAERLELPDDLPLETRLRLTSPPHLALGVQRVLATPGLRAKAAILGRELFPTRDFMRIWSPRARRGSAGMLAAYLWRPAWLLLHAPSAIRALVRARRH